jgi:hypothetical protein
METAAQKRIQDLEFELAVRSDIVELPAAHDLEVLPTSARRRPVGGEGPLVKFQRNRSLAFDLLLAST